MCSNGFSALHFAAAKGHCSTIKWLAEHGADVNILTEVSATEPELEENEKTVTTMKMAVLRQCQRKYADAKRQVRGLANHQGCVLRSD